MTIFERVKTALDTLLPVPNAMGRLLMASGDLPDTFLIYTLISGSPLLHQDNQEAARDYLVQVSIFNRSGLVGLPNVDAAMVAAGFTRGQEHALPQDATSGHYHLAKEFHYFENEL